MSGLSWAIYFAEVLEGLKIAAGIAVVLFLSGAGVGMFGAAVSENPKDGADAGAFAKRSAIFAIVPILLVIAAPSAKTVYLMVGVEAATRMAATTEAREILSLVRQRLVAELQPASK